MGKRKRASTSENPPAGTSTSLLPQVGFPSFRQPDGPNLFFFQKRYYRQRAHANPFSDHALEYPTSPQGVDWDSHYPSFARSGKVPEFADVGCGFGGLLISLAPLFPDTLMLGPSFHISIGIAI